MAVLQKPCATPHCTALVSGCRFCPPCEARRTSTFDEIRGTAAARGYDAAWQKTRALFRRRLLAHGIAPVCGARLPGAPVTHHSQCQAEGRVVEGRQTDHIVPHRGDRTRLHDLLNLQCLCDSCHSRKTATEDSTWARSGR